MIQRKIPASDELRNSIQVTTADTPHQCDVSKPSPLPQHMTSLPAQRLLFETPSVTSTVTVHLHILRRTPFTIINFEKPFKIITVYIPLPSKHLHTFYEKLSQNPLHLHLLHLSSNPRPTCNFLTNGSSRNLCL